MISADWLDELTVRSLHESLVRHELTAVEVAEAYLNRIASVEASNAALNAFSAINEVIVDQAACLDATFQKRGELQGPLHGVIVAVKDQFETADMATSFGSVAFRDYRPSSDATAIRKLKQAGALIIGKTTMPDFACSFFSASSLTGWTKNPYARERDAGGSSSGTAAAVAANLALVGLGEDTNGSIRVPAAFNNLVGLRVTTGLISRSGMMPGVLPQDTPGPMTRTVEDAARLLDVLAGSKLQNLTHEGSGGLGRYWPLPPVHGELRVGVLRNISSIGEADTHGDIAESVVDLSVDVLRQAGVTILDPVCVERLCAMNRRGAIPASRIKYDVNRFLASRPGAPFERIEDIYSADLYHPLHELFVMAATSQAELGRDVEYSSSRAAQSELRAAILAAMASERLDALIYPTVANPAPLRADVVKRTVTSFDVGAYTTVAARASLPAVSLPGGFTAEDLPIGIEMLGRPNCERTLLNLARRFEALTGFRRPPSVRQKG